jgi:hypothetical protein
VRVLIDECLPRHLKTLLADDHVVETVPGAGWSGIKNGALLRRADPLYDVLVTADRNIYYQQRFDELKIALVVLPTNKLRELREAVEPLKATLSRIQAGMHVVMDLPPPASTWSSMRILRVVADDAAIIRHEFGITE